MDGESVYTSMSVPIQSKDIIIACTDGLMDRKLKNRAPLFIATEAEGDYDEDAGEYPEIILDYTQFEAIIAKRSKKEALAEYIGKYVDSVCVPACDDMTIIAIEISP